jgi:hypothetical protein
LIVHPWKQMCGRGKKNKNKLSDDVCHEKLRNITKLICKPEMWEW